MRSRGDPSRRRGPAFGLAVAAALAGCASVVGLDGLAFDREGEGGGAGQGGANASTSAAPDATSASSSTTTATSSSTSTSSSPSSSSSSATSSSTGTGTPLGGGGGEGYLGLITAYDAVFYRFGEPTGTAEAGDAVYSFEGTYEPGAAGTVTYEVPGVFDDDTAVAFAGGASVRVARQELWGFDFVEDEGAFTITFFAKLDAAPPEPLTVASCFDGDAQLGWILRVGADVVIERFGLNDAAAPANESTPPMTFPTDGEWHLVTIQKLSGSGQLRGFVDDVQLLEPTTAYVTAMLPHEGDLILGADPAAEGTTPSIALDEMAILPYGLNDVQLEHQITCLQGGSCAPPRR